MCLDKALAEALEPMLRKLDKLEQAVTKLRREVAAKHGAQPIYDANQLQELLGYSKHEAYAILREYGTKSSPSTPLKPGAGKNTHT